MTRRKGARDAEFGGKKLMKWIQMPRGPLSPEPIGHGTESFPVSSIDFTALVPDHVADFMIADGRSGVRLIEDPVGDPRAVTCPHCGRTFIKED